MHTARGTNEPTPGPALIIYKKMLHVASLSRQRRDLSQKGFAFKFGQDAEKTLPPRKTRERETHFENYI
jgi:hypothetical protein